MPFQFERSRQSIDALIEQPHHVVVGAINHDFAPPHSAAGLDLHTWIRRDDPRTAHVAKSFPHAVQDARAIVTPLVLIIATDKICRSIPVFVFNRVKNVLRVSPDLLLRSPKPDEIQPSAKKGHEAAVSRFAQRDRHRWRLYSFPVDFAILARRIKRFTRLRLTLCVIYERMAGGGIEPPTRGFSVRCSTN
jgi:hypothetical protein